MHQAIVRTRSNSASAQVVCGVKRPYDGRINRPPSTTSDPDRLTFQTAGRELQKEENVPFGSNPRHMAMRP